MLVILSPFGIEFGLEDVECLERIQKSCSQFRIVGKRCLEL